MDIYKELKYCIEVCEADENDDLCDALSSIKLCVGALVKERDEALSKLAAMESQEPTIWAIHPEGVAVSDSCAFMYADEAMSYAECHKTALYDKPVPADKPAVAVPSDDDLLKIENDIDGHYKNAPFYPSDATKLANCCLHLIAEVRRLRSAAPSHSQQSALEPVEGDLLPPVGTNVDIHLASDDKWVNHKVVGYYVWGPLGGVSDSYSRVFVRVVDGHGIKNARLLKDIKWDRCPSYEENL